MTYRETYAQQRESILRDYFTFLKFPSIATDPEFADDVHACAHWLQEQLQSCGLDVELWETSTFPTLFATDLRAGPDKETLLIYCHYDVQPVDPLNEWESPPFEPQIRDGKVYARGAVDDKGQCFYTLQAIKALIEKHGRFPLNLKFIIEGEEESGSTGLYSILEEKAEALAADHLLIVDSALHRPGEPVISVGARGMIALSLSLRGSSVDLHSGLVGGVAYNPNRAMVELLASLHDSSGYVNIPGFYDNVVQITPGEKEVIDFSFDEAEFTHNFGAKTTGMEQGVPPGEAVTLRPTLEINGIHGGYGGPGIKTVIPAKVEAKITCRLVPQQDPERIALLLKEHLLSNVPGELELEIDILPGHGWGFRTNPHSKIAEAMRQGYETVFEKPCTSVLMGGSIPIAGDLARVSGADVVLVGVGLPTDRIHAPNEHFGLDRFEQGFLTICHGIEALIT